jgi:hypothetical protein
MDCGNVVGSLLGERNNNHQNVILLCKISSGVASYWTVFSHIGRQC